MKIGLLPLYIALYDESSPHVRPRLEAFYEKVASMIEEKGIQVIRTTDFCRLKPEFEQAVAEFEQAEADAIVTLHMAYSPSLESIEALTKTELPIIVLDTTETLTFTPEQSESEIMYNHGIHGVMDLCSMLKRYGKEYTIVAGHYEKSDVIDRMCGFVRAVIAAKALRKAKVGLIGGAFEGMGDFAVEPKELKARFGITIENLDADVLEDYKAKVEESMIQKELEENKERFLFDSRLEWSDYEKSVRACLATRVCIEGNEYTAFSTNFRTVSGMPFMECCKAMERGIGYAGEGDGLTAAFTGALLTAYPETSFVEIFCPDWENDMVFLSHMGEVNYRIADGKPLVCPRKDGINYAGYARMKGGKGVYVNISRGREDYQLLLAPARMLSFDSDKFEKSVRGWMKPERGTTAEFLEAHSRQGATHHSIFVYGATVEELSFFGSLLSMETVVI